VKSKYGKLGFEEKTLANGRMQIEYPIDGGNIFFYFSRSDEQKIGSLEYVELGFWKSPSL
jgi:hypothetical protein